MRSEFMNRALNDPRWFFLVFGALICFTAANAGTISITRQDTGIISGSIPAYQYDMEGNFLGTIGPQGNSRFVQDITYDLASGDLWALIADPNNSAAATIANLTQGTSFGVTESVFVNRGANLAVFQGSVAAFTRQDTGVISGSIPAYQYDGDGNFIGTIGPQGDTRFIQDVTFDSATGDLWALIADPNNAGAASITNLTQGTSFSVAESVFVDRGANLSVFNDSIAFIRQDTGIISGSIPAYQYDANGNFLGTIGPQGDTSFIQDIAHDPATGDLWALIADPNDAAAATIANLTQGTSFLAGQSVFVDRGANISVFSSSDVAPIPEPSSIAVWSMLAGMITVIRTRRRRQSK